MYERFTDRARKVMQLANQEAQRFNHEYIGTEHLLLGLVKVWSGVSADALSNREIDPRKIRLEVEKIVVSGPEMVTMGKLPQTPRAKRVMEAAMQASRSLGCDYVGTEHILLGLLSIQEGVAYEVLASLGVTLDEMRAEVSALLDADPEANLRTKRTATQPLSAQPMRLFVQHRSGSLVKNAKFYAPFIGQDLALKQLCVALARRWRNSVLIVGQPGSGRTALVERLALEISQASSVFPFDCNIRYFGSPFESESKRRRSSKETDRDVLLVRDIQDLLYDPEQIDSQRLGMIREMDDGRRFIGTTTPNGLAEIDADVSLRARFETVYVSPADKEMTFEIVRARARHFGHHLEISDEALEQAYELSNEFADQLYPGHVQPALMLDVLEHAVCWARFGTETDDEIVLSADDVLESVNSRRR